MRKRTAKAAALPLAALMAVSLLGTAPLSAHATETTAAGTTAAAETTAAAAGTTTAASGSSAASTETQAWEGADKASGLSGKITYMHFGDDYEREMYENLFKAYNEKVPDVEIEQQYVPDDYYTKLQTLAASNTLPDIFWIAETRTKEFADAGLLTDVTDMLNDYPAITSDMIENVIDYGTVDGKVYAIPKDWTGYVMYLNTDLFDSAGVEVPTSDWTIDDYESLAQQLTTKTEDGSRVDTYGTAINNYRADWVNWMGNYGAEWFKDGKSNLQDENAKKGLSVMYDLVQNGSAPSPGTVSATGDSEDRLFITGKVAMYPSGRWVIPSFRQECTFNWNAIEMPQGTTRTCPFICGLIAIGATSENKDAAMNLISYQLSDEGLSYVMPSALSLPLYQHVLENPDMVTSPPDTDPFINEAAYLASDTAYLDAVMTGHWAEYGDIITNELSNAFEGQEDLDTALKNIDEKANSELFTD